MDTLIIVMLIVVLLALAIGTFFGVVEIIKNLATADKLFTVVNEPEIKIILRGSSPHDCICNVKDHTMMYRNTGSKKVDWTLIRNEERNDAWLKDYDEFKSTSIFGYFFFGILPNRTIARTKIDAARWKEKTENMNIRTSLEHNEITVSSLRAKTERRIVFQDLEIGGDSTLKIDAGFTVIIKLCKPLISWFDRRGQFGEIIDESLKEIVTREALKLTADSLFASNGASKIQIFDPSSILHELSKSNISNSGYIVTALIYHGYDFTPDSMPVVEEKARVKMAEFKRAEQLQQAEANKRSRELEGQGRASAIDEQIRVFTKHGVNADVAAHNFGRMIVAEAVAGESSDITMWIEQGAGMQFAPGMIPQNTKPKKP